MLGLFFWMSLLFCDISLDEEKSGSSETNEERKWDKLCLKVWWSGFVLFCFFFLSSFSCVLLDCINTNLS